MKTTSLLNRKYHCQLIGFCTQHNFTAHLGRRCTMKCTWVWWLEPSGLPPEPWRSAQCIPELWRGLLDDYASMFPSWNSVQKFCDELSCPTPEIWHSGSGPPEDHYVKSFAQSRYFLNPPSGKHICSSVPKKWYLGTSSTLFRVPTADTVGDFAFYSPFLVSRNITFSLESFV